MGINSTIYALPADRGDVGTVSINAAVALHEIADALEAIQSGGIPTRGQIEKIRGAANILVSHFNFLSGWTDDVS